MMQKCVPTHLRSLRRLSAFATAVQSTSRLVVRSAPLSTQLLTGIPKRPMVIIRNLPSSQQSLFSQSSSSFSSSISGETNEAPQTGYPLALHRAANIMINVAERALMKTLHVPCGDGLHSFLGNSGNFDIIGVSASADVIEACNKLKQYSSTRLLEHNPSPLSLQDNKTTLPFNQGSFQIIVSMLPPESEAYSKHAPPTALSGISIPEVARLLGDKGFVLIGAPESIWENENVMEQINDSVHGLTMLSLQAIPCEASKYYLCLARKEGL